MSVTGRRAKWRSCPTRTHRSWPSRRGSWRHPGAKEQAIHDALSLAPTRYYQILNELIDTPEALRFDPVLIKRLRRQRSRRQRMRSPRPE